MKYNYHTHTSRCFHAKGTDEDYVLAAIEAGFDEIGFADHTAWEFDSDFVSNMRMPESQLKDYCDSIKSLREKYKDKISIKLGLECEYFPKYIPWLRDAIKEHGIDYVILGHHFATDEQGGAYNGFIDTPEDIYRYRDDVVEAMETGLFSYVAHPDLFMRGYNGFDEHCKKVSQDIINTAVKTGTPLEYNLLGLKHGIADGKPGYPDPDFWAIASELKPKTIVGIDAHDPSHYLEAEHIRRGYETLEKLGLPPVDTIKFLI